MEKRNKDRLIIFEYLRKNKHNILVIVMILSIVASIVIYKKYLNVKTTYTVVNGYVEKTTDTISIILKDETVIELNNKEVAMPIVEQNKRVAKGDTIAVYKNSQYDEYVNQISELDKTIETLIVDLPASYSNDVSTIDSQITELAKEAKNETSYIKIQEYKSKIDELLYKKVLILGERSPDGSKVKELIEQRAEIEKNSTSIEENNILAPVSGVAMYKIDDLENVINFDSVFNYDEVKLEEIISKYTNNTSSNFGIKVVDNYHAYILVKEKKGDNDKYIKVGNYYTLKFSEKDVDSVTAKLEKVVDNGEYNYVIFSVDNGIEELVDLRTISTEVVWKKETGMAVPKAAIKENLEKRYHYVTLVYGSQYIDVPINILIESDNTCIVDNLSKEEKEELGIETTYILELYDKLII